MGIDTGVNSENGKSYADETAMLHQRRKHLYCFLSGCYLHEIDGERLNSMKKTVFPIKSGLETLDEGYSLLAGFLETSDESCLDELAVDYAKTFLSAGVAVGQAAFPYQSAYAGGGSVPAWELAGVYAAKGLQANGCSYRVPDDHIGLQLAYMAHLCGEATGAKNPDEMRVIAKEQKSFLDSFLFNWYYAFCRDLEKYARTDFYKALAKITAGFLSLERQLMEMEAQIWDTD